MNLVGLDEHFARMLVAAESFSVVPYVITSGLRTVAENKRVGGVKNSSHLNGLGVDLKCNGSLERYGIVNSLLSVGFRRIGIASDHVHVDMSIELPQAIIWIE